jgi:hypothetical protein
MNMDSEVVSAFLDGETFDPADLARALAEPGGRQMLLDLVALRTLVRDEPVVAVPRATGSVSRPKWMAVGFLAASVVFAAGAAWVRPSLTGEQANDVPPTPDHVVVFDIGAVAP